MPSDTEEEEIFEYDPDAAERGWEETASLRAGIESAMLPAVDLADVSILGLRVARALRKPEVRAPFAEIRSSRFDIALLDRIEPASWAVWYANTQRVSLEATESGGRVSVATLATANGVKSRMMRVVEYLLIDHPKAGPEIVSIRSGTGHKDLASDLTRLARLYRTHRALLERGGGEHYDAADETAAKTCAGRILFEVGEDEAKSLKDAKDDAAKAFVVLEDAYDRIRRWGAALWDDDDHFPSLFSVRPSRGSQRREADAGSDGNTTSTT